MRTARVFAVGLLLVLSGCGKPAAAPSAPAAAAPDSRLQSAIEAELDVLAREPTTREVVVVALDPRTGAIVAMGGRTGATSVPDLPLTAIYPSGSVAKVFSVAAALDTGAIGAADRFSGADVAMPGLTIQGAAEHPTLSTEDVLVFSSNVGAARIYEKLGKQRLHDSLVAFGFGERPPIDGSATGELGEASAWSDVLATKIAFGAGLSATAVQYAAAFAAVAAGGEWHAPTRAGAAGPTRRVMSKAHADELLHLMEGVVHRDDGTGAKARVAGLRVSGKTGTTSVDETVNVAAFVGAVPADAPRLVMYVGLKTTARGYSGGTIAAPSFARIVEHGFRRE
jgi:cell division protein FtsI (penicillin-binding protein 3)